MQSKTETLGDLQDQNYQLWGRCDHQDCGQGQWKINLGKIIDALGESTIFIGSAFDAELACPRCKRSGPRNIGKFIIPPGKAPET